MSELSTAAQPAKRNENGPDWTPKEFLAMVAHELRNPILAIIGWADIVSSGSVDAETSAHAIEVIKRSALLEAKLINQLLDFSRISNGSLGLNVQTISLEPTLEAAIEMIKPQAWAKAIEIIADLEGAQTPIVGDSERLQQVFTNLLSNAIKFTPNEGRVQIRVEYERNYVGISISDTGRGISSEFLPCVFDRFRQAPDTTERGGLGLGLAITRYLVEEHGGAIHAESPGNGKGATFTVCLPVELGNFQSERQSEKNGTTRF